MNRILLILCFVLSLLSAGDISGRKDSSCVHGGVAVDSSVSGGSLRASIPLQDKDGTIVSNASLTGLCAAWQSNVIGGSLRAPGAGQRGSSHAKSLSVMFKSGKLIDNNHIRPFLTILSLPSLDGETGGGYLHWLCRLRL